MPGNISSVNNIPRNSNTIDQTSQLAKGLGLSTKSAEVINQAMNILSQSGIKIQNTAVRSDATGTPTGATGIPTLDDPADAKAYELNLEKLISYIQLDNEERQTEMARDRIETYKNELSAEHETRNKNIQKTLKDMEKAAASQRRNSIFGWIMTALAVVAAVVACVATGGLATGAVVAAGLALTCQILNETGAMESITGSIAKGLEKLGMDKEIAEIVAQVAITVVIVAASIAAGNIGGAATTATGTLKAIVDVAQPALKVATGVMGLTSLVSGGVGAYQNYKAGMDQADVTEMEKYIAMIRQKLEESQQELQAILELIQNNISNLATMLSSATDTSEEIATRMGQMA